MCTDTAGIAAPASPPASCGLHGLARAAWYSICDAADIGEMLVLSLLTGGAATAAACALTSLVLWLARTARAALARASKRTPGAPAPAPRPLA